jgi:NAD(P)-dependent dehydrogenase (short-subunit alcohol dehydrogenase family)
VDLFSLEGRVAVVTGALGLLGRRHCEALALAGADVVATDLDPVGCDAFAAELGDRHGREALGLAGDITDPASVSHLRDQVLGWRERLDVLVNNAAVNERVEDGVAGAPAFRFEDHPLALWEQALRVNVTGTFLCSQILGAGMAAQGHGSIVNIASTYGVVAPDPSLYEDPEGGPSFYKSAAYPTTKGAVLAFTRFLAAYWGRTGVRVNALSPGGVENGQPSFFKERYAARTPLGRMAAPGDYAGALVFLASEASAYMTGANLVVDGGWTAW